MRSKLDKVFELTASDLEEVIIAYSHDFFSSTVRVVGSGSLNGVRSCSHLFVITTPSSMMLLEPMTIGPPIEMILAFGWMTVPVEAS